MRNSKLFLVGACALLPACGTKQLGATKPALVVPKDTPVKPPGSCPATPPDSYHTVTITFPRNLPASGLGVKFPAEAGLRANQCATQPAQTGVILSFVVTAPNTMVVTVHHNKQFTDAQGTTRLPNGQALEVVQANCDGSNATVLYNSPVNAPPSITWAETHPFGINCAELAVGTAEALAADVENWEP